MRLIPKGSIFIKPVSSEGKSPSQGTPVFIFCNICGKLAHETKQKYLVRDHNHKTGYIRGILCSFCNQMLGIYESIKHKSKHILRARSSIKYIRWVKVYYKRIEFHLTCNTGIKYSTKYYIPLAQLIH